MKKIEGYKYKTYMYVVPTIILALYLVNLMCGYLGKWEPILIQESEGFSEFCKAISGFSSVVLGIYGFIVPIVLSKQEDTYVKKFWTLIDRDEFIKDMKRVILSSILTILISIGLLIVDVMPPIVVNLSCSSLIWLLVFFAFSSYRFIGILITLAVGKKIKNDSEIKIEDPMTEEKSQETKQAFDKF